jgi:hypothetical protein
MAGFRPRLFHEGAVLLTTLTHTAHASGPARSARSGNLRGLGRGRASVPTTHRTVAGPIVVDVVLDCTSSSDTNAQRTHHVVSARTTAGAWR